MELVKELEEELQDYGIGFPVKESSASTLQQCAAICEKHKIDAAAFVLQWLAYAATNSLPELSSTYLNKFECELKSYAQKESVKPRRSAAISSGKHNVSVIQIYGNTDDGEDAMDTNVDDEAEEMMDDEEVLGVYGRSGAFPVKLKKETKRFESIGKKNAAVKSPQVGLQVAGYSPAILDRSEKYGARAKSGDVISRYKCKDSSYWEKKDHKTVWKVELVAPTYDASKKNDYKYMFQKTKEVSMALSFLMEDTSKEMLKELGGEGRANLEVASVDESIYLGRIRSDGKLTSGSVFFEGCLDYSDGHIVDLDLSALEEYYVFPGQIVVLEGRNELGKCLRVSKMHVPKPLEIREIIIDPKKDSLKLNIMIASGPYTPGDSMQYEALIDLMNVVTRDEPDICIFIGPFLEATHQKIAGGELAETFEDTFQKLVNLIVKSAGQIRTQFVLMSSFKDVHGHLVYPTPPYNITRCDKITVVPDPASISIGGVVIAFTSTDILKHLSSNELAKSMIRSDRMGRLSRHILSQRNLYPLYPCDESVPLDVEHWIRYARMVHSPHILILPSDLQHFIKEVDGTIVVNPEHLTKGCSGGTFARIQVDLSSDSQEKKYSSIADFCVGEIVKI